MVRLFAHEVADVEPVLGMLSRQNPQDHEVYINLSHFISKPFYWLVTLKVIPFNYTAHPYHA